MASIRPLDPALVNKIAAGEVIERPASVVKELAENALDAGATRIDIAVEEGGSRLVRVTDNGCGIPGTELPLAVAPHATSKIATVDDLFSVRTLGFRGEAIASIASVSQFRIVSRPADQLEAYELRIDSDSAAPPACSLQPTACSGPLGTTVEVRNLFFNVPARRKFLRQPATELANITEQLARLGLAHPEVAFTLSHNGRELRNLPSVAPPSGRSGLLDMALDARRSRIADFYGPELAGCLLPVRRDERDLRVEALIAPPAQSRPSTKWQYLFLNGRFITDRRIAFAVREAFRGLIERERFPVLFLFLTCPPDAYDVNVHPTKIEVRWRDAGLVQSQILAVLRETLLSHDLTPSLALREQGTGNREQEGSPPRMYLSNAGAPSPHLWGTEAGSLQQWGHESTAQPTSESARHERTRQALADYLKSIDPTQARLAFAPPRFATENLRPSIRTTFPPPDQSRELEGAPSRVAPATNIPPTADSRTLKPSSRSAASAPLREPHTPSTSSVLQVHNAYLIAQTEDGVIIIDQHALHERILYERFRERILAGPLESQRLLIPATLEASPAQLQAATDHRDLLARLGIEVSSFGKNALAVQSFPTLLPDLDASAFVSDLLDKISAAGNPPDDETLFHRCLDMMACKAAVKAGDPLTTEEMQALLSQRHLTQRSSNCPHGRPTTLELTTRDLERQFKRI
jgi:DNA mismatch repair protein MutL